jgi:hypothetical protein
MLEHPSVPVWKMMRGMVSPFREKRSKMMSIITPEKKQQIPFEQDGRRALRSRNRMRAIIGAVVLLCAIGIGAFIYAMIAWTSSVTSPASVAAEQYYAAIKNQQYAVAYSHLDTQLTYNGALMSQDGYTQAAMRLDETAGKVIDYSISNVSTSWNFGQNIARATVHVTRAHQSYDVHLAMKLEGYSYKITSFDGI